MFQPSARPLTGALFSFARPAVFFVSSSDGIVYAFDLVVSASSPCFDPLGEPVLSNNLFLISGLGCCVNVVRRWQSSAPCGRLLFCFHFLPSKASDGGSISILELSKAFVSPCDPVPDTLGHINSVRHRNLGAVSHALPALTSPGCLMANPCSSF